MRLITHVYSFTLVYIRVFCYSTCIYSKHLFSARKFKRIELVPEGKEKGFHYLNIVSGKETLKYIYLWFFHMRGPSGGSLEGMGPLPLFRKNKLFKLIYLSYRKWTSEPVNNLRIVHIGFIMKMCILYK